MSYMLHTSNNKLKEEVLTAHTNTFSVFESNINSFKQGLDSFALQTANNKQIISIAKENEWSNGDIYYEEERIVSIFTDGMVGDFLQCKEDPSAEFEIDHDKQGTVMEYLQLLLPDFK